MDNSDLHERILLLTPTGRDASLIADFLGRASLRTHACSDAATLSRELSAGGGAAIIAEEALTPDALGILAACVNAQPPWSDLPLLVLAKAGESSPGVDRKLNQIVALGNVTVVERPVRPATLTSMVKAALRARQRQYQVDSLLQELRCAEDRLRGMIESARDYAIINLDLEGRVTYWNTGAERLLGYAESDIMNGSLEVIFPEEERRNGLLRRELTIARKAGRAESEGWRIRSDGSPFWASGVVTPNLNASGSLTGYVKVLRDITEHKNAEDRLAEQAKALQQSNEDLQRFAYVASHDLQEPLRMIGSYSQLLARKNEGRLDSDSQQFVRYIVAGVERMRTLIRDLLMFSSAASEQQHPPQPVDCNAILGLALQHLQFRITETGAKISFGRLPVVMCHENRLLQVFQNLIGNALKYSDKTPEVHVSATQDGEDQWCISVRDNGIGIRPEDQERVFGLFARLHSRSEYPGTGIGLATCKRIIEQAGGRIWMTSTPGSGSTFYFTVPAAKRADLRDETAIASPINGGGLYRQASNAADGDSA